ncbi:MAG: hypothetical protein KF830_05170 [Planctomycetes bacterium]|nr:hypothetical protein [Planctomycetota bacterium]
MTIPRLPLAWFLSAAALTAQSTTTLPASHATVEGTSSTNVPFGRSTPVRVQCAYDGMLFAGPVTITQIAFRPDGGGAVAAKVVDCEIRMSTMPLSLVGMSPDFGQNRGGDETVVLPLQQIALAAQAATGTPGAFLPAIPLAVPFAYDPSLGPLLVEIAVHGQPPGAYLLDVTYACDSPDLGLGANACTQSSGLPLHVASASSQVMWGRPWIARATGATPGAIVVLAVGTIDAGPYGGMVLPQDLGALGAPGCVLGIDVAATWFTLALGDGSALFPFTLTNSPLVIGEWIRFQAATLDPTANALGLVTSQAKKVQICGWEPVARVWSSGLAASFGTKEIGLAPVLRLTVQ